MNLWTRIMIYLFPPTIPDYPPLPTATERVDAEASIRWRRHNEAKRAAGCPCGGPATKVRYTYGNRGWVPVENWTCAAHEGATGWRGYAGAMQPLYPRPVPCGSCSYLGGDRRCGGHHSPIGMPPSTFFCPQRTEAGDR